MTNGTIERVLLGAISTVLPHRAFLMPNRQIGGCYETDPKKLRERQNSVRLFAGGAAAVLRRALCRLVQAWQRAQAKKIKVTEMDTPRIGRQTPTQALTLPYEATLGQEAVDLYARTGRAAQPWQQLLLYDLMARDAEGLWVHSKFGYSVPRRNGKNEVVAMRELWGLLVLFVVHSVLTDGVLHKTACLGSV